MTITAVKNYGLFVHKQNSLSHVKPKYQESKVTGKETNTPLKANNILSFNGIKIHQNFNYKSISTVSFMGYPVHIVDGGNHATNMQHFSNAISKDMDTDLYLVDTNPDDKNLKQLRSLETQLRILNNKIAKGSEDYVAIPALATVPLLNLQDQYTRVMNKEIFLTPENIKSNKQNLLAFLKKIYDNQYTYQQYISYMDPKSQGIENTYAVIQEINKLVNEKNLKVFVPAGHPHEQTLKWMAKNRGLKDELYTFISTGIDENGQIKKLEKEIKDNNWYDFNLLALSDAQVVTVKDAKQAQDYMFAAYDTCITKGERGVYNFSPIRKEGKLIGYSYTDTKTNEYPFDEFPANNELTELNKFVGKQLTEVCASDKETEEFKKRIEKGLTTYDLPDKLYSVHVVYPRHRYEQDKMSLKGDWVNKAQELFFDVTNMGTVLFRKCNCEGTIKPSVLSMWGSCFSVFNAIKSDIEKINKVKDTKKSHEITKDIEIHLKKAQEFENQENYNDAEGCYNYVLVLSKALYGEKSIQTANMYYKIAEVCYKESQKNFISSDNKNIKLNAAQGCYNEALDVICRCNENDTRIPMIFRRLGNICKFKSEDYPAYVCFNAADEIEFNTAKGKEIISKRANGVRYIV